MKNQLDKAIRRVMAARHAEHRRAAVLVILALLTILSVSWRLHQVGIAMTDDEYSCGYEEHKANKKRALPFFFWQGSLLCFVC